MLCMSKSSNRHVNLDEKLSVLQEMDQLRRWYSLDDRRVCVLCDRLITGRMIDVWQDKDGSYRLHCPTPGCTAGPRDWFYHGPAKHAPTKGLQSRAPVIGYGNAAA